MPESEKSTSESTMLTIQFLKACNKMFKRGIIGKQVFVKDVSCPIIVNMEEGFHFFTSWLDERLSQGNVISCSHAIFAFKLSYKGWSSFAPPLLCLVFFRVQNN